MTLAQLIQVLNSLQKENYPAIESHYIMAPKFKMDFFRIMTPTPNCKKSAVLLPLIEKDDELHILFTQRSKTLNSHSGQISFPGGRIEPGELPLDAALRETYEEIGISRDDIEVIGSLSDLFVQPSNSLIHTYIGKLNNTSSMLFNSDEVESIIQVPLSFFLDKNNILIQEWNFADNLVQVPLWNIGGDVPLWGATAMILMELLCLISLYEKGSLFLDSGRLGY